MALESFYGGRPGITPVIKTTFKYIDINDPAYIAQSSTPDSKEVMDLCFAQGDSYTKVWYNELCIIDADNKNNPNNGHLYRRTLKGAGDTGEAKCAEYLGRIVGASGANPALIISNLDTIKNLQLSLGDGARVVYPTNEDGSIGSGNSLPETYPLISASKDNNMLVSGKEQDDIKYTWVNIMSDTEPEYAARIYMGFQIPYPVTEFEVEQLSWITDPTISNITEDKEQHPFYDLWRIGLPQGVRGNAASGLRTAYPKDFRNTAYNPSELITDYLYDFSKVVHIGTDGNTIFEIPPTETLSIEDATPEILKGVTENSENQNEPILVYDYYIYNKEIGEEGVQDYLTFFLGYYRQIADVKINDAGVITVDYKSANVNGEESDILNEEENHRINWITNIEITSGGLWTITGNNPILNKEVQLPYPTSVGVSALDGKVTVNLANNQTLTLKNASSDSNQDFSLDYVDGLAIDKDSKVITAHYFKETHDINLGQNIPLNNKEGLNYVSAAEIDGVHHLLLFFASNQYRPLWENITENDTIKSEYNPKPIEDGNGGYRITWHGQKFRNGFPKTVTIEINGTPTNINVTAEDFWLDLGLVRNVGRGIRIFAKVKYTKCPIPLDLIKTYNEDEFIQYVLNPEEWTYTNQEVTKTVQNPYYNGHVGHYIDENSDEIDYLATEFGEEYWGGFIYAPDIQGGTAYYYDYEGETWESAGSWGESSSTDIEIDYVQDRTPVLASYGIRLNSLVLENSSINTLPNFWSA